MEFTVLQYYYDTGLPLCAFSFSSMQGLIEVVANIVRYVSYIRIVSIIHTHRMYDTTLFVQHGLHERHDGPHAVLGLGEDERSLRVEHLCCRFFVYFYKYFLFLSCGARGEAAARVEKCIKECKAEAEGKGGGGRRGSRRGAAKG